MRRREESPSLPPLLVSSRLQLKEREKKESCFQLKKRKERDNRPLLKKREKKDGRLQLKELKERDGQLLPWGREERDSHHYLGMVIPHWHMMLGDKLPTGIYTHVCFHCVCAWLYSICTVSFQVPHGSDATAPPIPP